VLGLNADCVYRIVLEKNRVTRIVIEDPYAIALLRKEIFNYQQALTNSSIFQAQQR
jgi:sRNA-binding carbon storage regulator CsrA